MHSQRHVCHEQSNEVVRRCDSVMVGLGYKHMLQQLSQDDVPCSSAQADAPGTSNDHQSLYTLSVRTTDPRTSEGESVLMYRQFIPLTLGFINNRIVRVHL